MIPKNLTIVRLALGFKTKTSFSDSLELKNSSYLSNLESGQQPISEEFLNRLCAHFPRVNKQFIRDGQGEPLIPERPTATITSSFDRLAAAKDYLLDIFSELSAERQAQIVLLARVLLDKAEENKKNESAEEGGNSPEVGDTEIPRRKVA